MEQTVGNVTITATLNDAEPETVKALTDVQKRYGHLRDEMKEHFYALFLNAANEVLAEKLVGLGNAAEVGVDIADIARTAVLVNARAVILAHNHPSGDPAPSDNDVKATEEVRDALDLFDVSILDHVIVSRNGSHSMHQSHRHLFNG